MLTGAVPLGRSSDVEAFSATSQTTVSSPSYEDVEGFLASIANWLQEVGTHLNCTEHALRLSRTVAELTAVQYPAHHPSSTAWAVDDADAPVLRRSAQETRGSAAAVSVIHSIELSVLCSLAVLVGLWWCIWKLLASSFPGLQARRRASLLRERLRLSERAVQHDVLLGSMFGALRRRTNQHQLVTACGCTAMAGLLIGFLLTVHVWTGVMLWHVWESLTTPMVRAWTWAAAKAALPPPPAETSSWTAAVIQLSLHISDLLVTTHASLMMRCGMQAVWQLVRQLQVLYVWYLLGSAVLGLSLWLLEFARQRMDAYNASVPFVTSRFTEPPLLHQLAEAEGRRRHRAVHQLLLENARMSRQLLQSVEEIRLGAPSLLVTQYQQEQGTRSPLHLLSAAAAVQAVMTADCPSAAADAAAAEGETAAAVVASSSPPSRSLGDEGVLPCFPPPVPAANGGKLNTSSDSQSPSSTEKEEGIDSAPFTKTAHNAEENTVDAASCRAETTDDIAAAAGG